MPYLFYLLIALSVIAWFLYQRGVLKTCPVCAAALLTWVIGLLFLYTGSSLSDPLFVAILIGATIGAVAEKFGGRLGFLWKTAWVLLGAGGVYFLLAKEPLKAAVFLGAAALATVLFFSIDRGGKTFLDRFKDCC